MVFAGVKPSVTLHKIFLRYPFIIYVMLFEKIKTNPWTITNDLED